MRRKHPKGRRRKGQGSDLGSSPRGVGGGSPHGGMERGIPVPHGGGKEGTSSPKSRSSKRKAHRQPEEKLPSRKSTEPKKKKRISRGLTPPSIPEEVAGAETLIDEVVRVPHRKKKTQQSGTRQSSGARATASSPESKTRKDGSHSPSRVDSFQASDTLKDDLDFVDLLDNLPDISEDVEEPAEPSPPERKTRRKSRVTASGPPKEAPTPPMGTAADDEDILEPLEEEPRPGDIPSSTPSYAFEGTGLGLLVLNFGMALCIVVGLACLGFGGGTLLLTETLPA
ncbi:MAG: hypothetical protein ACYTHN_24345, partial [Planctomycetota bacterium]